MKKNVFICLFIAIFLLLGQNQAEAQSNDWRSSMGYPPSESTIAFRAQGGLKGKTWQSNPKKSGQGKGNFYTLTFKEDGVIELMVHSAGFEGGVKSCTGKYIEKNEELSIELIGWENIPGLKQKYSCTINPGDKEFSTSGLFGFMMTFHLVTDNSSDDNITDNKNSTASKEAVSFKGLRGKIWKSRPFPTSHDPAGKDYCILKFNEDETVELIVHRQLHPKDDICTGVYKETGRNLYLKFSGTDEIPDLKSEYSCIINSFSNDDFSINTGIRWFDKFYQISHSDLDELNQKNIANYKSIEIKSPDDINKVLAGRKWQEQPSGYSAKAEYGSNLFSFNSDGSYTLTTFLVRKSDGKIFNSTSTSGTYKCEFKNGSMILVYGNSYRYITQIDNSQFMLRYNPYDETFVELKSTQDFFTKEKTLPYLKNQIENNIEINPTLEDLARQFYTVKGKSYVTSYPSDITGNETLTFVNDGTFFGEYQLAPQGEINPRMGIYREEDGKLITTVQIRGVNKTTVYKLKWINSSEFQISIGEEKAVAYKLKK